MTSKIEDKESPHVGHPLVELTLMRFREFWREPEALFWTFAFPILMALALGIAFRNRPSEVLKIATVTPELARSLRAEKQLDVQMLPQRAAEELLRNGKVVLLVEEGSGGTAVYRYDDTNPDARTARTLANSAVQRAAGRTDPVTVRDQFVREPGSRYIDFLIPGLLGLTLMSNAIWLTAFAIVDARRKKLLKRLVATPMPRPYYLASFLLSRLMLLVLEVGVLVGFGNLVFGVPVRDSLVELAALCVLASFAFCALGLLLASRARTVEAVSGLMNLIQVPMWVLSGVFFSAQRFPNALQPFIKALPLTATVDALRAGMLQGAGLSAVAPEVGILGLWLVVCFVLALRLFRWR